MSRETSGCRKIHPEISEEQMCLRGLLYTDVDSPQTHDETNMIDRSLDNGSSVHSGIFVTESSDAERLHNELYGQLDRANQEAFAKFAAKEKKIEIGSTSYDPDTASNLPPPPALALSAMGKAAVPAATLELCSPPVPPSIDGGGDN